MLLLRIWILLGRHHFSGSGCASSACGSGPWFVPYPFKPNVKLNYSYVQKISIYCSNNWKLWHLWRWRESYHKPALTDTAVNKNFKNLHWVFFVCPVPDPVSQSGSGSRDPIKSRSETLLWCIFLSNEESKIFLLSEKNVELQGSVTRDLTCRKTSVQSQTRHK
jgi:hypothetical protein